MTDRNNQIVFEQNKTPFNVLFYFWLILKLLPFSIKFIVLQS